MQYLIIALLFLAVVAAIFGLVTHFRGESNARVEPQNDCSTCTGYTERCPQVCAMEAAVKPIVYFDDEELDRYRDRDADKYTDEEVEEFAQVLYTMRPDEVEEWCNSLQMRGVQLPNQLKDETYAIVTEQRRENQT